MNVPSAADLSFILCGLIILLGSLLVWAIHTVDHWMATQRLVRVRKNRRE